MQHIFYRPKDGYLCDVIPFVDEQKVFLYYLHDYRNIEKYGEGTPWRVLTSTDFLRFELQGEAIARGKINEQDLFVFTGSAIKKDNQYIIFYTGHNPHFLGQKPVQVILKATSEDGIHYQKDPSFSFAHLENYSADDWRDPFVFYDEKNKIYKMLIAARKKEAIRRGGLTLCFVSSDLNVWKFDFEYYAPDLYFTHECPDTFIENQRQFLIFSEFSKDRVSRYVYSDDEGKKWQAGKVEVLDGRAYYAAKTLKYNGKRYSFGWVPTKNKEDDNADWQWGGTLVVHELFVEEGELYERPIPALRQLIDQVEPIIYGDYRINLGSGMKLFAPKNHNLGCFSFDFKFLKAGGSVAPILGFSDNKDEGYEFEVSNTGIRFNLYPNPEWHFANFVGVERRVVVSEGIQHHIDVFIDNDIFVLYLDNHIALSTRIYNQEGNHLGVKIENGDVMVNNIEYRDFEGVLL